MPCLIPDFGDHLIPSRKRSGRNIYFYIAVIILFLHRKDACLFTTFDCFASAKIWAGNTRFFGPFNKNIFIKQLGIWQHRQFVLETGCLLPTDTDCLGSFERWFCKWPLTMQTLLVYAANTFLLLIKLIVAKSRLLFCSKFYLKYRNLKIDLFFEIFSFII